MSSKLIQKVIEVGNKAYCDYQDSNSPKNMRVWFGADYHKARIFWLYKGDKVAEARLLQMRNDFFRLVK